MSESNPLANAHALSAQASSLLRPSHPPLSALQDARDAYIRAADLFSDASSTAVDDGAQRTLQLLVSQNRKLAKEVERRIAARDNGVSPSPSPGSSRRPSASGAGLAFGGVVGAEGGGPSTPTPVRGIDTGKVRMASEAGLAGLVPAPSSSTGRSIPPFALRPSTVPRALSLGSALSSVTPTKPPSIPTPPTSGPFIAGSSSATSPLYSSSSSSDQAEESYVNFGAVPDTVDPFLRFWARLDNMLDDISNPVRFASATVAPLPVLDEEDLRRVRAKARRKEKSRERGKKVVAEGAQGEENPNASPSGSYYLVPQSAPRQPSPRTSRNASPSTKTPEELALENENLRASLDALAVHAQALDEANKALRAQAEERDKVMQSVVVGVRREAIKAKQGADLMRSQLLQQSSISPRIPSEPGGGDESAVIQGLRRRVRDLEEENATLKSDNEKQKSHVAKYKDRFEKIKVNARAKKAAREGSMDPAG